MPVISELALIPVCILHQVPTSLHLLTAPLFPGELLNGFILYRTIHFYGTRGLGRQGRGTAQGAGHPEPN